MNNKHLTKGVSAAVAGLLVLQAKTCLAKPDDARPNIVFILMDDLGLNDLSCSGRAYHETPNMDRLVQQSQRFTRAYACASECSPSRACIITGQYSPRTDIYVVQNPKLKSPEYAALPLTPVANLTGLQGERTLMPRPLKEAGYTTGFFGKWHHGPDPAAADWNASHRPWKPDTDPTVDPKRAFTVSRRGIDFITKNKDKPFFLYMAHDAPHWPFESRPATLAKFEAKPKSHPKDRADYAAMLADADTAIGEFLDALDKLGLTEKTLVVLTSDNGASTEYTTNEPFRAGKGKPYEGGVRVPLSVRWPGHTVPGSTCDTPVIGLDLYPTFLAVAGVAKPTNATLDGVDLTPLFRGEALADERVLYWHCPAYNVFRTAPHSVIVRGDAKLIHWYEKGNDELFDLSLAKPEATDLAPAKPERHAALRAELTKWQQAVTAKAPVPNPNAAPAAAPVTTPAHAPAPEGPTP